VKKKMKKKKYQRRKRSFHQIEPYGESFLKITLSSFRSILIVKLAVAYYVVPSKPIVSVGTVKKKAAPAKAKDVQNKKRR